MPLPPIDLEMLSDAVSFTGWRGLRIDVERLYDTLTALGWKVDTEESNLMLSLSRTWRKEGIKVWVHLEEFVCAPPVGEVEALDTVCFYRFDPAKMPTETMLEKMYRPGDEQEDWYPSHREEWSWLVDHGDPQSDTAALLTPLRVRELPAHVVQEVWSALQQAIALAPSG